MNNPPDQSVVQSLFNDALVEFERQTGTSLAQHPLAEKLETCHSIESITDVITEKAQDFRRFRGDGGKAMGSLKGVVHVLHSLSTDGILGDGIGLLFPPATTIFTGVGILLSAIKDVSASYDALGDLFESIQAFLKRLNIYRRIPLKPAMCEIIVGILVELLSTFALATKEINQGRFLKFGKKLLHECDIEAVTQRLDKLARDESQMAIAETLEVVHGLVQNISVVEKDNKASKDNVEKALEMVHEMASEIKQSRRRKIQKWLSPPDPWKNYNIARGSLHKGTARWFTEGGNFAEWKSTSSLLWVHGKPGSGKSVLSSAIIRDVEESLSEGSTSLAFFFFDFRDDEKQTRRNLLSSLLVQLCNQSNVDYDVLFKFYSEHNHGSRHPSDNELTECLKKMLDSQRDDSIYIIIDALDECPSSGLPPERENVLEVVTGLVNLRCPNLHICVTSRPEPDIKAVLSHSAARSVSLHSQNGQTNDIIKYIRDVVTTDPAMRKWRPQDKVHVIEMLSQRADGMFRWVFCQLEYLRGCLPQRIQGALGHLPETLDETYTRTLQRISKGRQEHACRLFQCVAVASRPLRVEELAEFLAFEFGEGSIPEFNPDWRPEDPEDEVLITCSSLIMIVKVGGSRVIQFSHFSVKEYLISKRIAKAGDGVSQYQVLMGPANTAVVQACLAVLLKLSPNSNKRTIEDVPLAHYAARHWLDHALFENVSLDIQDGLTELFDPNKPHFVVWVWISATFFGFSLQSAFNGVSDLVQRPLNDGVLGDDFLVAEVFTVHSRGTATWLRLADRAYANARARGCWTPLRRDEHDAHLGDVGVISKDIKDLNAWDTGGSTPLAWALENEYLEFVWVLLKYGSNWRARDCRGKTPLHWASEKGLPGICRFVIDSGADVRDQDSRNKAPLRWALENGHLEVARVLLAHGANVDSWGGSNKTLLHWASENGDLEVVQFLLGHGANADSWGSSINTPLDWASENGHLEVVQLLLTHGANVDSRDSSNKTPLRRALENGHMEVARVLAHGANVDLGGYNKPPLRRALENGHLEVARVLAHGANVDSRDSSNMTPLRWVLENGNLEVAQVLLARGANVDSRDSSNKTSLHWASENGHLEVVRFLLMHGANVDSRDSFNKVPLHLASENGHLKVVQVLLNHGADTSYRDNNNMTPIFCALISRHETTACVLAEHVADPDDRSDSGRAPLHWAALYGYEDVTRILLGRGADAKPRDVWGQTPLHFVSLRGHVEVARLLLEGRADGNACDKSNRSPLHVASENGHLGVTQILLLDRNVDPSLRDTRNWTPLHLACQGGDVKLVEMLIKSGADIHARTHRGQSPSQFAWRNGHSNVVRLLSEYGAQEE